MNRSVTSLLATAAIVASAGCTASSEPELLMPDVVSVAWSDVYDAQGDGLGAIVPVDVMVYESATGAALANVELAISTEHDGTWVLPDGIFMRSYDPSDAFHDSGAAFSGAAFSGEAPFPTEASLPAQAGQVLWDARHDRYVVIDADPSELAVGSGNFATDADGVARIRLFVDSFPRSDSADQRDAFADVAVVISAASPEDPLEGVVLLQPR